MDKVREALAEMLDSVVTTYEAEAAKGLKLEFVGKSRVWCGNHSCWLYPGDVICEVDGDVIVKAKAALATPSAKVLVDQVMSLEAKDGICAHWSNPVTSLFTTVEVAIGYKVGQQVCVRLTEEERGDQ